MIRSFMITTLAQFNLDSLPNHNGADDNSLFLKAIHAALVTLGSIAVLIVALGGIRYVISRGDPKNTAKAKNTIIYAVLGLVIAMSADIIVGFVTKSL